MSAPVTWYFSRALGVIGLVGGVLRIAVAAILDEGTEALAGAVGTAILLVVGGLLTGAVADVVIQVRRRSRSREPERGRPHRKR